jgi:hypothetical protein
MAHGLLMEQWARIFAGFFCVVCYVGFCFRIWHWLQNDLAGHKVYLKCVLAYFWMMAVYRTWWIVALYFGTRRTITYAAFLSAFAAIFLFIVTEFNARKIENTLECSEAESKELTKSTKQYVTDMKEISVKADEFVKRQQIHIARRAAKDGPPAHSKGA